MSGSNTAISRRRLLQGAGAMWLLSVKSGQSGCGQPGRGGARLACVQLHPRDGGPNRQLKYKQFALSNPERVVVDIEDVNLNSVLKGMAAQIRADDPFIKSGARRAI